MDSNFYTKEKNKDKERFTEEFKRIKFNAVYFLEMYWNKMNPDNKIVLSDEEKQELFDKHKGVPSYRNFDELNKHQKWVNEMKEKGYKDWEIQ